MIFLSKMVNKSPNSWATWFEHFSRCTLKIAQSRHTGKDYQKNKKKTTRTLKDMPRAKYQFSRSQKSSKRLFNWIV